MIIERPCESSGSRKKRTLGCCVPARSSRIVSCPNWRQVLRPRACRHKYPCTRLANRRTSPGESSHIANRLTVSSTRILYMPRQRRMVRLWPFCPIEYLCIRLDRSCAGSSPWLLSVVVSILDATPREWRPPNEESTNEFKTAMRVATQALDKSIALHGLGLTKVWMRRSAQAAHALQPRSTPTRAT